MSEGEEVHSVNKMSVQFVCVLFQEGECCYCLDDGGTLLNRCWLWLYQLGIEGPERHREPLIPVGFSCVCSPVWR